MIRVASYNVHGCRGLFSLSRARPARIAAVLREIDADIVGLQEVSSEPGPDMDQLQAIAEAAGYPHAIAGGALRDHRGDYGNALLSRLPVARVANHQLGRFATFEPRGALEAEILVHSGDEAARAPEGLRIVVTHLGLKGWERERQTERLLGALQEDEHADALRSRSLPLILLGDLNAITSRDRATRMLESVLGKQAAPRTLPSWAPVLRLDRILASPADMIGTVRAHTSWLARRASDHLPVYAEIDVPMSDPMVAMSR